MKLSEKRRTILLLEKLRFMHSKAAYISEIAYQKEKRLVLKKVYENIFYQKQQFIVDIECKIEKLKKEISPTCDARLLSFYKRKKCEFSHVYLKYKMNKSFPEIYKREEKAFQKTHNYLAKINHSEVRALLLDQIYVLETNIREMNATGIGKYPII